MFSRLLRISFTLQNQFEHVQKLLVKCIMLHSLAILQAPCQQQDPMCYLNHLHWKPSFHNETSEALRACCM